MFGHLSSQWHEWSTARATNRTSEDARAYIGAFASAVEIYSMWARAPSLVLQRHGLGLNRSEGEPPSRQPAGRRRYEKQNKSLFV